MAPGLDFSDWWGKEIRSGTPVVVTMQNPNYSVLEIDDPDAAAFRPVDKGRGKNAKQVTWVLLLKAHRAVGCVAWLAAGLWSLLGAVKKRVFFGQGCSVEIDKPGKGRLLFRFLRGFLVLSIVMLALEMIAYWKGWHFKKPNLQLPESLHMPDTTEIQGWMHNAYLCWLAFRADYIALPIQVLSNFCIVLFMIQSLDRMILCLGCFWIKLKKIKPTIDGNPFKADDVEISGSEYPMVLIQVYEQSISAACQIDWPRDRVLVQVLDDSNDETIMLLIRAEVSKWSQRGVNIVYRHRLVRTGYKAGNLKSAMSCDYVKDYEFVAIFDADFTPNPDFLKKTIPHFKVNGVFLNFFGFNGTAGVWRIKALEDSGGWLERTTVEDMDIAVRAHLSGWKFIFLNDVKVAHGIRKFIRCFALYKGLMSYISVWKKANLVLLFFLLRKLILPFYSFTLFCVILPLSMFVPEAELPVWVICYIPFIMSFLNILPAPRSFPFIVPYLLFENTMSVTKFNAMVVGLFQLGSSYEWIVTKKAGRSSESDLLVAAERHSKPVGHLQLHRGVSESELMEVNKLKDQQEEAPPPPPPPPANRGNQIYKKELALALLLLTAAVRSLLSAQGIHFYFLLFQGVSFLLVGLDLIGEQMV
ncbi:hypothetical protein BHM03_00019276 [Ensete ventricosum]|uniref:Glycosyltransferase 2-like domain-containing protein n=1 Tax=Ensete ventricosum TaxID=4639 RepID=A0A445MFQ0_ENSVE|nr:hypothetical protein BHM03_00019276 [Ensete ventricosum]